MDKQILKIRRAKRTRARIFGTSKRPRLSVFRSSKHIYAQLIDDSKNRTLVSANDQGLSAKGGSASGGKKIKNQTKVAIAYQVGQLIAQKATKIKIKKVVFDRGPYKYHGRIKNLAEGARKEGLNF